MRLGQLARKLELSPTEIISYLTEKNVMATEGSNTRLTAEQVLVICRKFDPVDQKQVIADSAKKEEAEIVVSESPVTELQPDVADEIKINEETPQTADLPVEPVAVEEINEEIKTEVIKAPKVELSGLKILGKIELPQPKKKEPVVEQQPSTDELISGDTIPAPEKPGNISPAPEKRERVRRHENKKFSSSKNPRQTSKNPIALQREREAQEMERKREEELQRQKEKRTEHYLKKVKSVPTKAARLIDEETVEMHVDNTRIPKTWLGKFWKWFRS